MSMKTTNLQLNLTDTASETTTNFQDWRRALDGYGYDEPSNMEIIDAFAAETKAALASKVPNAYGEENANKVLSTDENGNVVLTDNLQVDMDGYVTTEDMEAALSGKVSVEQGTNNAGKILGVGDDGKVALIDQKTIDPGASLDEEVVSDLIDKKVKLLVATFENDSGGLTYIFDVASDSI